MHIQGTRYAVLRHTHLLHRKHMPAVPLFLGAHTAWRSRFERWHTLHPYARLYTKYLHMPANVPLSHMSHSSTAIIHVLQFLGTAQSLSRLCTGSYTVAVLFSTPTRTVGPLGTRTAKDDRVWLGAAVSAPGPPTYACVFDQLASERRAPLSSFVT